VISNLTWLDRHFPHLANQYYMVKLSQATYHIALRTFHEVLFLRIRTTVDNTAMFSYGELALWRSITLPFSTFVLTVLDYALFAPSPLCLRTILFKYLPKINFLHQAGWRLMKGHSYRSKKPLHVSNGSIFLYFPHCSFLCGNGAPLFLTCFDHAVLL
jgi:hypothetical protein